MELDSLARRRAVLEDNLLEAMINVEEVEEAEAEAAAALIQTQANWDQNQENMKAEQAYLLKHIQELAGQREQLVAIMTRPTLKAYENAKRRASITAVVLLRNGRCLGCQVTVPANLVKAVDEGKLVTCDSCSRILCPV
jgi:predicted  nucleic acid-binding Zn-ribbon protein